MSEIRERPDTAAKIIQRESATDAVQDINETMCVIEARYDRRFRNLEA